MAAERLAGVSGLLEKRNEEIDSPAEAQRETVGQDGVTRGSTAGVKPDRRPSPLRALAHRDFRLFIGGQLVSLIGTWMQGVAQSWLVYRLTGSSVLLGFVGFAGQIPVLILSPLGGSLADTKSRHRIIIRTQTAAMILAFVLAALTLLGWVQLWHVFALATLLGIVNAYDIPARQSFLVQLVGRDDLMNAIALNSSMFNAARILGPAIAGVLVAAIGEGWCFFVNGVSYLAVLAGLLLMHPKPRPVRPAGETPVGRIVEGFAFVARTPPIRSILLLLGLVSLSGMPYSVLMPIFADQILHSGARGLGILMGSAGVGALLGALALAWRREVRGLGRWIAWATACFGAGLIAFSLSRHFWLSTALLVPVGFSMIVETAASNTLVQAMVPDALRGRVMSVYSMMFMGMAPFGCLLAGFLADRFGAPTAVAAGGLACILGAILFGLNLPTLRVSSRQLLIAQEITAGDPGMAATEAATTADKGS
jgi:MFS family permease